MTAARARIQNYRSLGLPEPEQIVFQSWDAFPTRVLPETSATSLTSLVDFYYADPASSRAGPVGLYRLNAPPASWLYSTNPAEVASASSSGWVLNGIAAYLYPTSDSLPGLVAVRRLYNSALKDHFYACDPAEAAAAQAAGYVDEGVAGYGFGPDDERGIPLQNARTSAGTHFYSVSATEAAGAGAIEPVRCGVVPF